MRGRKGVYEVSADAVLAPSLPEARLKMEQMVNCDGVAYLRDGNKERNYYEMSL